MLYSPAQYSTFFVRASLETHSPQLFGRCAGNHNGWLQRQGTAGKFLRLENGWPWPAVCKVHFFLWHLDKGLQDLDI